MRPLAALLSVLALLGGACGDEPDTAPPPPRPPPAEAAEGFEAGLITGADPDKDVRAAQRLGARLVRAEFPIGTPAAALAPTIAANAAIGARVLPLAGFHGRMPTAAEARNLASWASAYGPGGTFWKDRDDGELAVREIEFGNETSFTHQYGDAFGDASYARRARDYALRVRDAHEAIERTGREVGLLVQADDAGFDEPRWIETVRAAVPDVDERAAGWTVHPYGPSWQPRIDRLLGAVRGGAPVWVTEWGVASDDGACLDDNYGWDPCLTYAEAASTLRDTVAAMRRRYGSRLRALFVYQSHDQAAHGLVATREHYFGALRNDLTDKGEYTAAVRRLLASD